MGFYICVDIFPGGGDDVTLAGARRVSPRRYLSQETPKLGGRGYKRSTEMDSPVRYEFMDIGHQTGYLFFQNTIISPQI